MVRVKDMKKKRIIFFRFSFSTNLLHSAAVMETCIPLIFVSFYTWEQEKRINLLFKFVIHNRENRLGLVSIMIAFKELVDFICEGKWFLRFLEICKKRKKKSKRKHDAPKVRSALQWWSAHYCCIVLVLFVNNCISLALLHANQAKLFGQLTCFFFLLFELIFKCFLLVSSCCNNVSELSLADICLVLTTGLKRRDSYDTMW